MNPEATYLENLRTIERIAAFVARRHCLDASQAEEFVQEVSVRLFDNDYAIIRKFQGRSSLSTYLTTVIGRLFVQWRVEQWGKWRPSAEAKRLGEKAVTLERLLTRDGYTIAEAIRMLTTPAGSQYTVAELERIYLRLPPKHARPLPVGEDLVADVPSPDGGAYEQMEAKERDRAIQHACRTLDELVENLHPEDRLILQFRFWDGRTVPQIAQALQLDQKKLYKRLDHLFGILRKGLEKAGVSKELAAFLGLDDGGELSPSGPSNDRGGDNVRGGEGRIR